MLTVNLALVSLVEGHDPSDVARVAAALQRQAVRDLEPIWDRPATVDAFPRLEDVPVGYWPMIVETDIGTPGAAGVHMDKNGQPFALIQMSDSWSLTASHEMLEMLVDPFGNRVVPGQSPKDDQGRVEILVEVSDPCESDDCAYTVNDVLVSDFYTPHFFDPVATEGARYDFTGKITEPREVLPGGYMSWHDPVSNHWWQEIYFGRQPQFRDIGVFDAAAGSLRAWIDSQTEHPGIDEGLDKSSQKLQAAVAVGEQTAESASSKAEAWREQIASIKDTAKA
jgi:hypothetical protein